MGSFDHHAGYANAEAGSLKPSTFSTSKKVIGTLGIERDFKKLANTSYLDMSPSRHDKLF